MTLKQKTVDGLAWSFIDNLVVKGFQFAIGIILARILSPREFGLIGMVTIFIAISQSFVDSGFSQALIRKKDCTQADYSTVFYFNLVIGIVIYIVLFFCAGAISTFFTEPILRPLVQVVGLSIVLSSFGLIQSTIIMKEINFKLQAWVSFSACMLSGIIAIVMAYNGYGVWSLVVLTLSRFGLNSLFLWFGNKWRPLWTFSSHSFKELFSYGSKMLASGLLNTIFENIYYVVIGKYFSAVDLGYYTTADKFNALPSKNITEVIQRVSFPVLSRMQDDKVKLKANYRLLIRSTMLITFVLMIGLAAVARQMILTLIGAQWLPSVVYLQMLCFVGMFYPLHALNLNMLQVQGRSDLFLRLEIIKKILIIPVMIIGIMYGIKIMIVGMMVITLIAYYLNSYWSGILIGYPILAQVKDILPSFILALFSGIIVFITGHLISATPAVVLLLQCIVGLIVTFSIVEGFKMQEYLYIKEIVSEKIKVRK
jgi:O-antigen/teichoic acid export membrane protein